MQSGRYGPGVKPDFLELFRALDRAGVEHVIVGGVAAILEGAPVATLNLDIVYRSDDDNLRRLTTLLDTNLGPLDAMQQIGAGWSWTEVLERSHVLQVGELEVRVLDLASVIESKVAANRDKDRAMLPLLLRTMENKETGQ